MKRAKSFVPLGFEPATTDLQPAVLTIVGSEYATVITGLKRILGLYLIGEPSITELILEI
jgi:hypothetical protein